MKIFFAIMGCAVIIAGAAISAHMLIDRQFVLFQAWDIALIFGISLLISAIPFGMAAILVRVEKFERLQKEDYNLLERKMRGMEKAVKNLHQILPEGQKVHILPRKETPAAKSSNMGTIDEFFEAVRSEHGAPPAPTNHIKPYAPPPTSVPYKGSSPVSTYKGMRLNKAVRIALFFAGIICLLLSAYYLFLLIYHGRWDEVNVRLPQLIQLFGGIIFMVLSKILKNQERIILQSLKRRNDIDNAGPID
jgi:hypothetical protein